MSSRQCGLLRGSFTRFTLRPRVEIRATLGVTWQRKKREEKVPYHGFWKG